MQVSAVIPTYNCSRLLRRAIDSVLAQSIPVELIVVDDGSSDDTATVVASYGNAVRYLYQPNAGAAAARNAGICAARGEWIAFLDHDDEWLPTKTEKQLAAIKMRPESAVCYTWCWLVNHAGDERLVRMRRPERSGRDFAGRTSLCRRWQ